MPSPLESMRIVARRLQPLETPFAFVGGAVMWVLVDHPELTDFRPTKDVDVVVKVATYEEHSALEVCLRAEGFHHDISEGTPICRWTVAECKVDIMPMESRVLGMNCRWFPEVLQSAQAVDLGENCTAKVVTPALFLATKLEALKDRLHGDFHGSHDLEDIITLADGRRAIVADVTACPGPVRSFIASSFASLLESADFHDAFPGHLSAMTGARERAPLILQRFREISELRRGPSWSGTNSRSSANPFQRLRRPMSEKRFKKRAIVRLVHLYQTV